MNKHYNKTIFQGKKFSSSKRYFEGWYYKQVNHEANYTISFIPGISYNKIDPHCFIQCIICNEKNELSSHYLKYDLSKFSYNNFPFSVKINNSIFSKEGINIDIEDSEIKVKGNLFFEKLEPLPVSKLSPNIMGIFSYIPKMECNHHIISMKHKIIGSLIVNDKTIDLANGFGYIEKDWGTSFPSEYIWLQCNHFENSDVKITFSAANIPLLGFSFRGFFCSLIVDDKEYRFATYNKSKLIVNSANNSETIITLVKGDLELNIIGEVDDVQSLASPKNGVMDNSIKEGLDGRVSIVLINHATDDELSIKGNKAGVEIMMRV